MKYEGAEAEAKNRNLATEMNKLLLGVFVWKIKTDNSIT